jgi:hypothetical protein
MPALECLIEATATPDALDAPINMRRGDDVIVTLRFRSSSTGALYDFTGWTFAAKAKASFGGATWSTANVTHGGTNGVVTAVFPKTDTTTLTPDAVGVWDLQGTDASARVRTIAAGTVTVLADVT